VAAGDPLILAGDLGGTKVALGLFDVSGAQLNAVHEAEFHSRDYARFEDILDEFCRTGAPPRLRAACLAVAGAVAEGRVYTTNLPWVLEERALAGSLGVPVRLINDLEGTAYGVLDLPPAEFHVLNPRPAGTRVGNIAVIAAGTGLGEAILYWDGERHHAIASEGGHADFAPRSDEQMALLRHLRDREGHVSYERVLSGPGLNTLYEFLRERRATPPPAWLEAELGAEDRSAVVARVALAGTDAVCVAALDLLCSIYGAEAGNLALKCLATDVIVAGGVAPKILPALARGTFMRAFTDKGRFSEYMKQVAVRVALNPRAALLGAARCAQRAKEP
jgi:glucokinase